MALTAVQFIDAKGGPTAVAKATGYSPGAVSLWKNRNRLPRTAWPELLSAYADLSLDDLRRIEARAA